MSNRFSTKTNFAPHELTQRALRVVLEHWMIPNLGWTTKPFQEKLPQLRQSITEYRLKDLPVDSNREVELLKKHLENEVGYFDEGLTTKLKQELDSITLESFMGNLIPADEYAPNDIHVLQMNLFHRFFEPVSNMLQHQTITFVLEIEESYLELHCKMVKRFISQQFKYQVHVSLIAHQLIAWQRLTERLELLELVIFNFALIPLLMEIEVETQRPILMGGPLTLVQITNCLMDVKESCRVLLSNRCHVELVQLAKQIVEGFVLFGYYLSHGDYQNNHLTKKRRSKYFQELVTQSNQETLHQVCFDLLGYKHSMLCYHFNKATTHIMIQSMDANSHDMNARSSIWKIGLRESIYLDLYLVSCHLSEEAERYWPLEYVLDGLEEVFAILVKLSCQSVVHSNYVELLEETLVSLVHPLAKKYQIARHGEERFHPHCLLNRELSYTLAYTASFRATYVKLQTRPFMDDYEEDDEDDDETRNNKHLHAVECYLLTQSLHHEIQVFEQHLAAVCCATNRWNDINYDMLSVASNIPMLQSYFPAGDRSENHHWFYIILCCYRQDARCIFQDIRSAEVEGSGEDVQVVSEWRALFERITSMSHEGKWNKDVFLIGLLSANLLGHWRKNAANGFECMSSEVQMIGSLASLWFAVYGTGRCTSPFLTPTQKCLHEMELKLLKIQLMITKVKLCLDNANDDRKSLKQMISGSIQEVSQRMDCIPWKTMLTMISALNSEASRTDTLDCASTECNLTLLSAFVFWVERLLEIALMRSEAISEIDLCRNAVVSLDQSFLEEWLPKFDWIHDKALTVARLFSYFQDNLCSEHSSKEKALIWLCKKVSSPHLLNIFDNGDQSRATQEVICLANEWYSEYRKVIEVEVKGEIEEAKDQAMNKAFALFV